MAFVLVAPASAHAQETQDGSDPQGEGSGGTVFVPSGPAGEDPVPEEEEDEWEEEDGRQEEEDEWEEEHGWEEEDVESETEAGSGDAGGDGDAGDPADIVPGGEPSQVGSSVTVGEVVYSIMPGTGIALLDVGSGDVPVVIRTIAIPGGIRALQLMDATLLVIMQDYTVVPVDVTDPLSPVLGAGAAGAGVSAPPGEPLPPPEPPPPPVEAEVVKVTDGWVVLDAGSDDGVEPGRRFAIFEPGSKRSSPAAVVVISEVTDGWCTGPLPPRGVAEVGWQAETTHLTWKTRLWANPKTSGGYFGIALDLKPIIGANDGAGTGGMLTNLDVYYRSDKLWKVGLLMFPGGFGHSAAGWGGVFEVAAYGGISHRWVAYTWGVGAHLSAGDVEDHHVLIVNRLRLGNVAGFHLKLMFSWIVPNDRRGLPTTTVGSIDIPVHPRLYLYMELGGGNLARQDEGFTGWANFIGGVRTLITGAGGPGTLILSTGMGVGYVWAEIRRDAAGHDIPDYGGSTFGVLVHIGIDWRL